jgi:hypothetical protein
VSEVSNTEIVEAIDWQGIYWRDLRFTEVDTSFVEHTDQVRLKGRRRTGDLQIAERAHVSMNSIKSYIRSAYRKIGVERRVQAVLWAVANGFVPDIERTIDPALRLRPANAARRDSHH